MKNLIKIFGSLIGVIAILYGLVYVNNMNDPRSYGSIQDGQAYTSSSTDSTYAASKRQFKSGGGVLGSVIVTGTSATVVEIKNATSTTDIASTTLAIFAASPSTNTYTFDAAFDRGLVVNFLGSFAGKYTITYR